MFNVQFPGLGIDVKVYQDVFTLFGHPVRWYGLLIATGFLLAFIYAMVSCKKLRINQDKLIDAVIVGAICGVVGARLYYVLFFPGDQYIKNPISALYIWEGGLGIYGGLFGGLLGGALMAKHRKLSVFAVLDIAVIGFLIGQAIGRWGNFVNQEAYGVATDLPWRMVSEGTSGIAVHPCFLYESLWCALGVLVLHIFSRKFRRYDGQVFLVYLIWYGVERFFVEGLRTDSLVTPIMTLRVSQVVAVLTVAVAVALLVVFRNRTVLTGIGSKKVMELNGLFETDTEVEEEKEDEEEYHSLAEDFTPVSDEEPTTDDVEDVKETEAVEAEESVKKEAAEEAENTQEKE